MCACAGMAESVSGFSLGSPLPRQTRCFQLRHVFLNTVPTWQCSRLPRNTSTKNLTLFSQYSFSLPPVPRCFHMPHTVSHTLVPSLPPLLLYHLIHPTNTMPQWHQGPTDRAKTLSVLCSLSTRSFQKSLPLTGIRVHTKMSMMSPLSSFLIPPPHFPRGIPFLSFSWEQLQLRNLNYDSINMHWMSSTWQNLRTRETISDPSGTRE